MYDIALAVSTHDLMLTDDGDIMLINNAERIAQQIKITLLTWRGEWFLDTRFGVPYMERVLKKNPNMNHVKGIIRAQILSVPGVTNVQSIAVAHDRKTRQLYIDYEAETTSGLITRREVLGYE